MKRQGRKTKKKAVYITRDTPLQDQKKIKRKSGSYEKVISAKRKEIGNGRNIKRKKKEIKKNDKIHTPLQINKENNIKEQNEKMECTQN